jgi:hypothetical protein
MPFTISNKIVERYDDVNNDAIWAQAAASGSE